MKNKITLFTMIIFMSIANCIFAAEDIEPDENKIYTILIEKRDVKFDYLGWGSVSFRLSLSSTDDSSHNNFESLESLRNLRFYKGTINSKLRLDRNITHKGDLSTDDKAYKRVYDEPIKKLLKSGYKTIEDKVEGKLYNSKYRIEIGAHLIKETNIIVVTIAGAEEKADLGL